MSREIKFRAWDKVNKKMFHYGNSLYKLFITFEGEIGHYNNVGEIAFTNDDGFISDQVELMQFTGLFDDTGIEIFDGDIVEIQNSQETGTSYKSQVTITCDGALVSHHPTHIKMGEVGKRKLSGYCDYGFGGAYHVSCKIIGNIHSNPSLLVS